MKKKQITKLQFFAIFYSYLVSNDLIRGYYHRELGIDVWIPTALSIGGAIMIFFIYSFIYKNNNYNDFSTSIENIVGKLFSKFIFILYSGYFIFMLYLNLRDITEILQIYLLQGFKIPFVGVTLLLLLIYILFHDIEPFARYSTFTLFTTLMFFISFSTLIFLFNELHLTNILPILENGYKPIIEPTIKMSYSIPMGGLFVMLFIFQYVKDKQKSYKAGYYAILAGGFLLLNITIMSIFFLNNESMQMMLNPSMNLWRRVDNDKFIQRFDLIVLCILVFHMVIKLAVFAFASKHLLNKVVKLKKENIITIFISGIIIIGLMYYGKDYTKLTIFRFNFVIPYVNLIFEIFIPFTLVILSFIRRIKLTFKNQPT